MRETSPLVTQVVDEFLEGSRRKVGSEPQLIKKLEELAEHGQLKDWRAVLSAIDPFLSQAGSGELAAFGPLGQMGAQPFFTAGQVQPFANNRFGTANRRAF